MGTHAVRDGGGGGGADFRETAQRTSHVTRDGLCVGACAVRDDRHLFPGRRRLGRRLMDARLIEVGASYEQTGRW